MMIPEPWAGHEAMSDERKAFYEYHGCLMEPWDGPASIAFTDGTVIGAVLDRNGLRPSRYYVTRGTGRDGLRGRRARHPAERVLLKERLHPGRIFLVDTAQGRIIHDEELKRAYATQHPYGEWLKTYIRPIEALPEPPHVPEPDHETVLRAAAGLRLHARGPAHPARPDGHERRGAGGLDGHRHVRWPCCRTARGCSTTTSSSSSPR